MMNKIRLHSYVRKQLYGNYASNIKQQDEMRLSYNGCNF